MRLLVMDRFTVAALLCVLLTLSSLQHQQSKAILSPQLLCLISEDTHGCNVGSASLRSVLGFGGIQEF